MCVYKNTVCTKSATKNLETVSPHLALQHVKEVLHVQLLYPPTQMSNSLNLINT